MSMSFCLLCLILLNHIHKNASFHPKIFNYLNTTFTFGKHTKDNIVNRKGQCRLAYSFIHFRARRSFGESRGAEALGGPEIPQDQQQFQIVLLAPHQHGTKQGRRCSHATWSVDDHLGRLPIDVDCILKDLLRQSFPGHSGHMAELTLLGFLDSEKWLDIPGFTEFTPVLLVTNYHTENFSQISHICRSFF